MTLQDDENDAIRVSLDRIERMILRDKEIAPRGFKWALVPDYPVGIVVGPCVCGSWPGGECLKCPVSSKETGFC